MATYFARGGTTDNLSTAEKREALAQALLCAGGTDGQELDPQFIMNVAGRIR